MPYILELLEASIAKPKLQSTITVIPVAVSDGYYNISLETYVKEQGQTVHKRVQSVPSDKSSCNWTNSIKLHDLLAKPNFIHNNSVMKIDGKREVLEGAEYSSHHHGAAMDID